MNQSFFRRDNWARIGLLTLGVGGFLCAPSPAAHAQTAPVAGTPIGNRASATYTDGAGISRETQSNQVTTTVQQVPAVALTDPRTLLRNPGSPVYFPHTVQNTGNGPDRFDLAISTAASGNIAGGADTFIYPDVNRDGVPDSQTPVAQTPTLAPQQSYSFVVAEVVNSSALAKSTGALTVSATSEASGSVSDSNADTVTATTGAVVALRKSVSASSGLPGSGPFTYSLRYTNAGTADSGRVTVTDTLPAGLIYQDGSATFNRLGDTPTDTDTDGLQGSGANGINYSRTTDAATQRTTVTFSVPSAPAGQEGLITFQFKVAPNAAPGIAPNTALLAYDNDNDGNAPGPNPATGTRDASDQSNTVDFQITRNTGVTFVGPTAVPSVPQGGTVSFQNTLKNTGTGTDTFNVTVANDPDNGGFPAGTSFQLFKPDGQSPLLDTNGDQIPDTGPVAPNGTYVVVLKATLPPISTVTGSVSATKNARSIADPTKTATATDTLTSITVASVNIDNGAKDGDDDESLANTVKNVTGNPGATVTIPLRITNNGGRADSYVLSASSATNAQGQPGSQAALPAGYAVVFQDATGQTLSNIGNLAPGATQLVNALVTLPAGAPATTVTPLYFTASSPTTNSSNTIRDSVTVNAVRAISVQPNLDGQVFPGSVVSYVNVVKNTGNQTETAIAIALSGDAKGFTSVVYLDANNNGVLDAVETTPITAIASLAAGTSQNVIVRVFGPNSTAQVGQTNVTTVKATLGDGTADSATDTTTLVVGDVSLVKSQGVLARAANGTYPTAATFAQTTQNARPGDRIRYRIVVTNTGATPVDNVIVFDSLPAYTSFVASSATGGDATTTTAPNANNALAFAIGTLAPGASATVTFDVQVDGAPPQQIPPP